MNKKHNNSSYIKEKNPLSLSEQTTRYTESSGLVVGPSKDVPGRKDITNYVLKSYNNTGKAVWEKTGHSKLVSYTKPRIAQTRAYSPVGATGTASLIYVNENTDLWLTNSHTVRSGGSNASLLVILRPNGEVMTGTILAWDDNYDISFFTTLHTGLEPLELFATSWRQQPDQGSEVIITGNPFSDKFNTTSGIVSDSGSIPDIFSDVPRTHTILDCVSRSGNSGGPAVDIQGKIVSINRLAAVSGGETLETIGWTIPSWVLKETLRRVLSGVTGDLTPVWIPEVIFSSVPVPTSGFWHGLAVNSMTTSRTESIGKKLTDLGHTASVVLKKVVIENDEYILGYLDGQLSIHDFSFYGSDVIGTLHYSHSGIDATLELNIETD
jgi:S1-C subfamily serine protease